ncbi:MAG: Bax inhibitor-1/YccA family protein [Candidatus Omnitrophica bacterium]|nr:Bax inhibitor-1/YccA family protein [Candidatus Omnitrophota bacterium]
MKSGNPVLNERVFTQVGSGVQGDVMTIQGAVTKTFILLAITLATAVWMWSELMTPQSSLLPYVKPISLVSGILGFVTAMVTSFKKEWAPVTAWIYAVLEGVFLGVITVFFNQAYPGIAMEAVALTFGVLFCLLAAYQAGFIRATPTFMRVIVSATMAIALVYLVSMVIGFFGIQMPLIYSSSGMGVAFSFVVVIVAALNLVLDFNFIEEGAREGAPKYMEWFSAFALLVTLIWLYVEILRLLAKLSDRR